MHMQQHIWVVDMVGVVVDMVVVDMVGLEVDVAVRCTRTQGMASQFAKSAQAKADPQLYPGFSPLGTHTRTRENNTHSFILRVTILHLLIAVLVICIHTHSLTHTHTL